MIDFQRINYDINGNARVICHFTCLLSIDEARQDKVNDGLRNYDLALKRAKKLGGRAYRAKWYGGGIVFKCDNLGDLTKRIYALHDSTEVRFYKEKGGNILAVFPNLIESIHNGDLSCYAHIGQHSRVSPSYLRHLKRANVDEYINLYSELKNIGYKLDVIK